MSDPKKAEPDEELLEFLGDIDQANEENQEEDFSDFLATNDIDKLADDAKNKTPPAKDAKHE